MLRMILYPGTPTVRLSAGLLVLRVVAGAAFMCHGWPKIHDPMHWAGDAYPGLLQALAALSEFGGGLAWILGLVTPLAAAGIGCTMAVAISHHVKSGGLTNFPMPKGYEPAAFYLATAVLLLLNGAGMFSADRFMFGKKE